MLKKVLIAEDHESANISIQKTLIDLGITNPMYVFYCDDALTWIQKALQNNEPYDLLITDLSFEEDHNRQKIRNGTELIQAVRQIQPDIKILVFSGESKPNVINALFNNSAIDGYVRKARYDAQELKKAITAIFQNKKYLLPDLRQSTKAANSHEFTTFDITIIKLLAQGTLQKDIPFYLQQNNIKPAGLSSIEKRLNLMKEVLGFSKNEQLVAYCKDEQII